MDTERGTHGVISPKRGIVTTEKYIAAKYTWLVCQPTGWWNAVTDAGSMSQEAFGLLGGVDAVFRLSEGSTPLRRTNIKRI